jgi:hypothetical protein
MKGDKGGSCIALVLLSIFYPINGIKAFYLVISIGRCKLRLSEHYVGLILQATIGGAAVDFRPKQISDPLFSFVVASRDVVFHIYKLKSFVVCEQYKVFFHLWGNGGPHWTLEYQNFFRKKTVNGPHFLNLEVKINTLMRMW